MSRRNGWFQPWRRPWGGRRREKKKEAESWAVREARRCGRAVVGGDGAAGPAGDPAAAAGGDGAGCRTCGNCLHCPASWAVGDHPHIRTGECCHPGFVFPRVIIDINGVFWTAGQLLNAACADWEEEDHVGSDAV